MAAVEFEGVWKRYWRTKAGRGLVSILLGTTDRAELGPDQFWALRDVSFSVEPGQAFAIIGPNGAGKTTILRLLARITQPTRGSLRARGRVAALINLGAGFHRELTGRENVSLNGVILGMTRREIQRKFDRIVEFAGLGEFIDTPVKHYSAGMHARLGFAIAAHVEPEVLLVDEVLSVGDMAFQRKCLQRMRELKGEGCAVVFVSHNMAAVQGFCDRGMFLNSGVGQVFDLATEAIRAYEQMLRGRIRAQLAQAQERLGKSADSAGSGEVEIADVSLYDEKGQPSNTFRAGESLIARISFVAHQPIRQPIFGFGIDRHDGIGCCGLNSNLDGFFVEEIDGPAVLEIKVFDLPLVPSVYTFKTFIWDAESMLPYAYRLTDLFAIEGDSANVGENFGVFLPDCRWRLLDEGEE